MLSYIRSQSMALSLLLLVIGGISGYFTSLYISKRQESSLPVQCSDIKTQMRKLWANYTLWTRSYIVAAMADAPEIDAISERLLQNQQQIGDTFIPFYGEDFSEKLSPLLKSHILIAIDLLGAAKARSRTQYNKLNKQWKENAHDIATLLNSVNPTAWPTKKITYLFDEIAQLTVKEVAARISKKWDSDIAAVDEIFDKAMLMADLLTLGIKQNPDK
jgi:hypothetical protein